MKIYEKIQLNNKNYNLKNKKNSTSNGITLIALVVTIIVLLILAGVSIQMLAGQSGILTQAKRAREETEIGQVKEYVQQEILEKMTENNGEELTVKQLHDIIEEYFEGVPEYPEDGNIKGTKWENFPENFAKELTTKKEYGGYEIEIGDIYSGDLSGAEKPTVKAGDMEGENLKEYQGSYVDIGLDINEKNGTEDDWEIFYAGAGRTFLIAADYVPVEKLKEWEIIGQGTEPKTKLEELGEHGLQQYSNYTYSVNWGTYSSDAVVPWMNLPANPANFTTLIKHDQYNLSEHTTNPNAGGVSQLLNTEAWEGIKKNAGKSSKIEFAIGGPTLEMWCAAWNVNMPASGADEDGFKKIEAGGTNATGYYVSSEDKTDAYYLYMNGTQSSLSNLSTLGEKYPTFFPHTDIVSNCYGYWLASPSAGGSGSLMLVGYRGSVDVSTYYYSDCGVRPVVCLTSEVQLQERGTDEDGTTIYELV